MRVHSMQLRVGFPMNIWNMRIDAAEARGGPANANEAGLGTMRVSRGCGIEASMDLTMTTPWARVSMGRTMGSGRGGGALLFGIPTWRMHDQVTAARKAARFPKSC